MTTHNKNNRKPKSSRARNRRLARKQTTKLNFESLEPKNLLAAVAVGNATDLFNAPDTSSITALIANDGGDGISLREAVTAANNTTGEDTITFDGSIFTGGNNSVIRLTQGELAVTDGLSIDGTSATDVLITGDANGDDVTFSGNNITDVSASFGGTTGSSNDLLDDNSRVLNFSAGSGDLTLTGLTITGGRTTASSAQGGGIYFNSSSGTLTLSQSTLSGNSTAGSFAYGGGISNILGDVFLTNSTVSENSSNSAGGGISVGTGDVFLTYSTVSNNIATGRYSASGGGIRANDGNVSLVNSTVSGNSAWVTVLRSGGGISTYRGNIILTNSTVSDNSALGSGSTGGGIGTRAGDISLTNSTVSGNSSDGGGGGIRAGNGGSVSLTNSTVSGNSSGSGFGNAGGGIWSIGSTVLLVNSTVTGNSASGEGGGIGQSSTFRRKSYDP